MKTIREEVKSLCPEKDLAGLSQGDCWVKGYLAALKRYHYNNAQKAFKELS